MMLNRLIHSFKHSVCTLLILSSCGGGGDNKAEIGSSAARVGEFIGTLSTVSSEAKDHCQELARVLDSEYVLVVKESDQSDSVDVLGWNGTVATALPSDQNEFRYDEPDGIAAQAATCQAVRHIQASFEGDDAIRIRAVVEAACSGSDNYALELHCQTEQEGLISRTPR